MGWYFVIDWSKNPLQVLSFGGGVQSTAMLLFINDGLLPKPDIIIHADTGAEMPETVKHIEEWVIPYCENVLGIPFEVVTSHRGTIYDDYYDKGAIPIMGFRSCTDNFKIAPQRRAIRKIVGNTRGAVLAQCWLGITTDEERRRTESNVMWCGITYPLLDYHRVSRQDCLDRLEKEGLEIIKSGCFHCPYAGSGFYFDLRENHPDLFSKALELEANAESRTLERSGVALRSGLLQGKKLSDLDNISLPDSTCDSGAGCFI